MRASLPLPLTLVICLALMTASTSALAATGSEPYVGFRKHTEAADYAGATRRGAAVEASGDVRLAVEGLATGADKKLYGVKPYYYGVLESAPLDAARPFDTAIASWNAHTPPDTWIQVELRAYRPGDGHWTKYYNMGYWASATTKVERSSVARQGDTDGFVATDTLLLYGDPVYTRYQYRLTLFTLSPSVTPRVSLLSVMTSDSSREPAGLAVESDQEAWGRDLGVPQRSQMIYPKGGEVWCSPTSTSMVLAYWGRDVPVPEAAAATYDHEYEGNGNWPFNTAWAATYGLEAYVTRLGSFAQLEEWVSAGVPVVISYAFGPGELPGTPIPDSDGHIMVVRGFEADGDVIVNDPAAASDAEARRVYDREILERLWLRASGGTVYLIYPEGHSVPTSKAFGSW